MKKMRLLMPFGFVLIVAGFSTVVMLLWNWLMPEIFGLASISFWQALGLFVLARILFGSFGFGKKGMMMHKRMHHMDENSIHNKWMKMTSEQRREFIKRRRKFGFGDPFGRDHLDMDEQVEQRKDNE